MFYDLDFRYRRALEPEGLTRLTHCLAAVNDAVSDARNAGIDVDRDPAVQLLARRLSRLTSGDAEGHHPEDELLRAVCVRRLAELRHNPAVIPLALKGVDNDPEGLRAWRREGARTLRALARSLGLASDQYRLGYNAPRSTIAGDHELEGGGVYVRIDYPRFGAATAVHYRSAEWRAPGNTVRKLGIEALRDIDRLAARIIKDLGLEHRQRQARLV